MHGPNHYEERPDNGHKRVYTFTRTNVIPHILPPRRDMVWVYNESDISINIGGGGIIMTRAQLADILWTSRRDPLVTIECDWDHLYCDCPKKVITSRGTNYKERIFTSPPKKVLTNAQ